MKRDVSARVVLSISEPARLVFAIAAAADYRPRAEALTITIDGAAAAATELHDLHGTRLHQLVAEVGTLELEYCGDHQGAPGACRLGCQ